MTNDNDDLFLKRTWRQLAQVAHKKVMQSLAPNQYWVTHKEDQSLLTEVDLFLSNWVKAKFTAHPIYSRYNFFSEEDHTALSYPAIILDPIDGTQEFVQRNPECAVSLALLRSADLSDPANRAYIVNPFTTLAMATTTPRLLPTFARLNLAEAPLLGMVSRSEWVQGLFTPLLTHSHSQLQLRPVGSIAYKLVLLSYGICDFVYSERPKNIWDIAAGTQLAFRHGIHCYGGRALKPITKLEQASYEAPLLWCRPVIHAQLKTLLF